MVVINGASSQWDAVFGVLWGKSKAGDSVNLLLQHLLDTAAVAELLWDRFLAPGIKNKIDGCCGGRGRSLFALVCGLHDVGKASPAFQAKVPSLASAVRATGLGWSELNSQARAWHHTLAGAVIFRRVLPAAGWSPDAVSWVWPLIAGHHGVVPGPGKILRPPQRGNGQGVGEWETVQDALIRRVAAELHIDLAVVAPTRAPRRAEQLALAGAVIMADWIASDDRHFTGIDDLRRVSVTGARERANKAWRELNLRGGWDPDSLARYPDQVQARFGVASRPAQADAVELAAEMAAPGLLILEAPMGEGKTEAALAAAEVLAAKFGADGLFVGMPTQATSDPMFSRVRKWADAVAPGLPVGLLHGKRRFNPEWNKLRKQVRFAGVDEHGCEDPYGNAGSTTSGLAADAQLIPAEWFLGHKRGLLTALSVGTIDQLLHAATRTRHVMLRHTGLAGRVVVLDEVHAYDVYMAQFLFEALRWLADAGVPVVLLSATLPPDLRDELVGSYLQGALTARDVDLGGQPAVEGYPRTLSVCVLDGQPRFLTQGSVPWRPSVPVEVEVLAEKPDGAPDQVVAALVEALRDGGCALVVRNTVTRAQRTYAAVKEVFGSDAVLLHARLAAGERADRADRVLELLGRPGRGGAPLRPRRLVVVATQLAEQSFDVDVDLLITDLAPIDLLLQRIGRLHRHARPKSERGPRVRRPRVIVTGMTPLGGGPPQFPMGSRYVYGEYMLLRTASLVMTAAAGPGWSVPAQVPGLVARGYGSDESVLPVGWRASADAALQKWIEERTQRQARADQFLLAGVHRLGEPTLKGLHERSIDQLQDDDQVAAVVRDGEPSVEVVLVRRSEGGYLTLGGRSLGPNGDVVATDEAVLDEVMRASVRLPPRPALTKAALDELRPLPGWGSDPWLRRTRALELDDSWSARLGGRQLTYSTELGLRDEQVS
jgi:CRISPR-associated endonuclease/helicase Cas3